MIMQYENINTSIYLGTWFFIGKFEVTWSLIFDNITRLMLIPVILISILVQFFSSEYLKGDPHIVRYYSYLNFFTFQMIILVTADNFFLFFIGWEGIGLASYLLVNFWFTRINANIASLKAFLMNRIGDWGLNISFILLLLFSYHSSFFFFSNIHPIFLNFLLFFLLIGIAAKSAQIGLHTWLTSAMEGPTPVSALLHAATMVTAGIFLILRFTYLLEWSENFLLILGWFGALSSLLGALGGLVEYDIKKIIAFSTISQLGFMVVSSAIHLTNLSFWHLINHAFFKALLFLSAGTLIHAYLDNQDIRKFGSFLLFFPLIYNIFLIGNLSLIAFPFFTGFFSKDLILELTLSQQFSFLFLFIFLTAIFTSLYSIRLFIFTFYNSPNLSYSSFILLSYSFSYFFLLPLFILASGSLLFGYLTQNILFTNIINTFIFPSYNILLNNLFFHNIFSFIPLLSFFIFLLPLFNFQWKGTGSINILENFNIFYHYVILYFFSFSNLLFRYFDRGFLELFFPYGLLNFFNYFSYRLETFQTGYLFHYLLFLFFSILFLI